jgi:hypothetical protein
MVRRSASDKVALPVLGLVKSDTTFSAGIFVVPGLPPSANADLSRFLEDGPGMEGARR